jgi:hypothetical protein
MRRSRGPQFARDQGQLYTVVPDDQSEVVLDKLNTDREFVYWGESDNRHIHGSVRDVQQWSLIFEGYPDVYDAAARLTGDLIGYRSSSQHRDRDTQEIAHAMMAWAVLQLQKGGKGVEVK